MTPSNELPIDLQTPTSADAQRKELLRVELQIIQAELSRRQSSASVPADDLLWETGQFYKDEPASAYGREQGKQEVETLKALLRRYRNETPVGHQPHMICHLVDEALQS